MIKSHFNPDFNPNHNIPITALLEAILFLTHEPISLEKLQQVCQISLPEVKSALEKLKHALEQEERGLVLLERDEGYQLGTKPETAFCLERLFTEEYSEAPLSHAALETLSVIAFKQPVTKFEIQTIRGVNVDRIIDNLLKRGLIKTAGRKDAVGRPHLYVTTPEFLHYFGLKDLEELKDTGDIADSDIADI